MQNTVRVVTTKEHQYYGHRYLVGEEYDCEENSLPTFQKVGWVRPREVASDSPQTYNTRDMVAARPGRPRKTA